MPITRKPGPAQTVVLSGTVPDPPKVPQEVTDRFDSMASYQREMDDWWGIFKGLFMRDMDEIRRQFQTDEATASSSNASILATIAIIQQQLTSLLTGSGGSIPAQVASLLVQMQNLTDALALHIASTVTHGTGSDIVGTQDIQALDRKTIGLTTPGYGRFWPLLQVNSIGAGQSVTVSASDFMIVAGVFTIYGQLSIDGTFVSL